MNRTLFYSSRTDQKAPTLKGEIISTLRSLIEDIRWLSPESSRAGDIEIVMKQLSQVGEEAFQEESVSIFRNYLDNWIDPEIRELLELVVSWEEPSNDAESDEDTSSWWTGLYGDEGDDEDY